MNDATHTWSMQKVGGDYADQTMRLVLIPTDTPTEENMHELEAGVEALIEGDSCTIVEDGETMSSIAATGSCFELHVGTGDDSTFTMDTTGITGMAMYAQHVPTEFERDQHYLKDSAGNDIGQLLKKELVLMIMVTMVTSMMMKCATIPRHMRTTSQLKKNAKQQDISGWEMKVMAMIMAMKCAITLKLT